MKMETHSTDLILPVVVSAMCALPKDLPLLLHDLSSGLVPGHTSFPAEAGPALFRTYNSALMQMNTTEAAPVRFTHAGSCPLWNRCQILSPTPERKAEARNHRVLFCF